MKNELTLEQELERVLTIDGRGRPAKAQLLLDLFERFDYIEVLLAVREISQRKFI